MRGDFTILMQCFTVVMHYMPIVSCKKHIVVGAPLSAQNVTGPFNSKR